MLNRSALAMLLWGLPVALVAGYVWWVLFSYRFIPFQRGSARLPLNPWPVEGYNKLMPGRYENPLYGVGYTINSKGFRGAEFQLAKSTRARIIALGESPTLGMEVPDHQTWPSLLEQHLTRLGADAEVINAGLGGATSANHRRLLEQELLGYGPDIILYYAGFTDHNTIQAERYNGESGMPRARFIRFYLLYKAIQLRLLLLRLLGNDIEQSFKVFDRWQSDYQANLESMVTLAKGKGVRFVIATQVLAYPQDILARLACRRATFAEECAVLQSTITMRGPNWHRFLRQLDVLRIQERVAMQHGVPFLDLHGEFFRGRTAGTPLFVGEIDPRFARDPVHLSAQANEVIARTLAAWLSRELLPA
jgi:lysophospholipase L1-like esterase